MKAVTTYLQTSDSPVHSVMCSALHGGRRRSWAEGEMSRNLAQEGKEDRSMTERRKKGEERKG